MADETEKEAPEAEEVETPEVESDAPAEEPQKELSETERVAIQVGWRPESEWRGPKELWRPAEDYLKKGFQANEGLKNKLDQQAREFNDRLRRNEAMAETALTRQKKQLEDHYAAQLRYAASQGDLETYTAVEKARNQAVESFEKETAPVRHTPEPRGEQLQPEVIDFMGRNSWFNRDPVMTGAAVSLCGDLQEKYGDKVPLGAIMTMVENQMREEFPHKFNGQAKGERWQGLAAPSPQRVEGGQRPIKTSVKKGWDHLPAEAKAAGNKFIQQGIFKDKQAYADDYWALGD